MDIKNLSIQEKVGQMIIIGMDTNYITDRIKTMIAKYKIGGIILYRKNFNTYQDMLQLIHQLKELNRKNKLPLFIAIDQEGGRVNRMPREILNLPSANQIATTCGIDGVKESAEITGEILKKSGFNLNFAPVIDIKRFNNNHAIGDRCYGRTAEEVSKNGIEIMKELSKGGIIPVVKHFPGHGATNKDSHFFLPVINKNIKELENEDIIPFKKAIGQNAEVIMVGHLMIKDVDSKNPASLSKKIINDYLRNNYQYKGIIMTDDLKMRAISLKYGYVRAALKACKAGDDIIMIGASYNTIIRVIKKIEKNIESRKIDINDIDKRVERIMKLKEKYKISDEPAKGCNIEEINKRIEQINLNL